MAGRPFALSVKVFVHRPDGCVLLLRRSQASNNNAGLWDLPGGKVDPGEQWDAALVREVEEETGLRVVLDRVAGAAESRLTDRTVVYLILSAQSESDRVTLSSEHDAADWIDVATLESREVCPQFRDVCAEYGRRGDPR